MAGVVVAAGTMTAVRALVISADPDLRRQIRAALGNAERRTGEPWEYLEAPNGLVGLRLAWRAGPDVVVADEIASGAGAFAVAKDLRGAAEPFSGAIVLVLARRQDAWLARWSGADAWVTKPVDPFELADAVMEQVERRMPRRESA
jgi:DNA-binding response OmpR family regulator